MTACTMTVNDSAAFKMTLGGDTLNQYTSNTLLTLTVLIANAAGTPVNTTVDLKMRTPDGVVTDLGSSVTNTSTGNYQAQFLPTEEGPHQYEWIATGAAQVAEIGQFTINPAIF